jgi:hypothetical protein
MGYSLSWLAVSGKPQRAVYDELGFRPTGEREEIPEADLTGATLPNGWCLIVSNRSGQVASDAAMERLSSSGCELVTCFVEEHVMFSSATGWKDGRKSWSIIHDAQRGIQHLETAGELPPAYGSIRDRLFARQAEENLRKAGLRRPLFPRKVLAIEEMGCDYIFEIPIEVARELTGYQHDRDIPEMTGEPFEVLIGAVPKASTPPPKPSFWKRVFGR